MSVFDLINEGNNIKFLVLFSEFDQIIKEVRNILIGHPDYYEFPSIKAEIELFSRNLKETIDFLDHDCPVSGLWKDLSPHSSRSTSLALCPMPTHLAAQSCQTSWCDPAERPWTPYAGRHSAGSVSLLLLPPSRPVPKHLSSKHPFA